MSPEDQPTSDQPAERDPLDALLADAEWPSIEPHRVTRLDRAWSRISPLRRQRQVWALSLAAVVLVGATVGLIAVTKLRQPSVVDDAAKIPIPPRVAERTTPAPAPSAETPLYERVLIISQQRRLAKREAAAAQAVKVRKLVDELVANPATDIEAFLASLSDPLQNLEHELATLVNQLQDAEQIAAARLLTCIATRDSWPLLIELKNSPPLAVDATRAIIRLGDPSVLARLAQSETDPSVQQMLMAGLLERGDPQSVELFLKLVQDRRTATSALVSLAEVKQAPRDELFNRLSDPRVSTRMAAARTLGRLNDSQINAQLIQMVLRNHSRPEALIALAESTEPKAQEFLSRAHAELNLRAFVQAAENRVRSFVN